MKKIFLALFASLLVLAQDKSAPKPPKLVVFIAVDQFRYDYLLKFRKDYNSGLARLLTQGAVFTNGHYQHFPTVTAVGHATMLTGATPNISGIIANEWFDRDIKVNREVTSVEVVDDKVTKLGSNSKGASSPHRLLVSTLGDEMKMSGKWQSKVVGISIKDRSAIMPSGRMADGAYWFDIDTGNFVSSTWYFNALPAWVSQLNGARPADKYAGQQWRPLEGGEVFKTMATVKDKAYYTSIESTPFGNEIIEEFTERAIVEEKLGQRGMLDLLTVSFSANDYVGHNVGPDDPQVRDMAIRTDRIIGKLFNFLDGKLGKGTYIVGFTADHGVAPVPEVNSARRMPGGRINGDEVKRVVNARLTELYGEGNWTPFKNGDMIYIDEGLAAARKVNMVDARREAAAAVRRIPHVMRVFTADQIVEGRLVQDRIGMRVANGFFAERSPDLTIVLEPYWIFSTKTTGTTHYSPFNYDTHVPMILMGAPFKSGNYHSPAAVNDFAPTLATVIGVEIPSGSVGRILTEALVN